MILKNSLLVIAMLVICAQSETAFAKSPCIKDRAKLLALDVKTFDQTQRKGWRSLPKGKECYAAKVDLIREFRTTKPKEKLVPYRYVLVWHEAQYRAYMGQTEQAIILFEESKMIVPNRKAWGHYADTTIAFLRRDKQAAIVAAEALRELPAPARLSKRAAKKWPPKLNVAEGLIKCFERSYEYAVKECR